jgi:hypothetical protein
MWLTELFKAISAMFNFSQKVIPSDELREDRFEVTKPNLTEAQVKKIADKRNRLADEMFGDLRRHPELSIEDKVNYEATELDAEEKVLLIRILKDRLNSDDVYLRIKNKKSKFKI